MAVKFALVGNPNSGKTTLFNTLTGSNQFVGNWPGVTVEKKEGYLKKDKSIMITDLPGIYSLSPYTLEEVVSRDYLIDEKPDVIINIIDGTNLERNLYLTTQILELGIPTVIAVNMMDLVEKKGDKLNLNELEKNLRCKVVSISAIKEEGIDILVDEAIKRSKSSDIQIIPHRFSGAIEHTIAHIEEALLHDREECEQRWYAVKLFERDEKVQKKLKIDKSKLEHIENDIKSCEKEFDDDAESIITSERYNYIESIIDKCFIEKSKVKETISDKIDKIVTNRILALPIFFLIMAIVYYFSVTSIGGKATDWVNDRLFGEILIPNIATFFEKIETASWLSGLIVDGIVTGVGAVLGFLPQMFVLFLFLAILESCGYMARIAFIMDRIFRRFGLSGKSFIPMLIGTGCGVPAVMASRTIENERDRRMTIMTTTFIPCGAKLPIIALIAGALFKESAWVAPSAYFIGMLAIITSGIVLKKTKIFRGSVAPFVMELPQYHLPSLKNVLRSTWERGWAFIKKAGTIIMLATIFVWFASNYGFTKSGFGSVNMDNSILASIGKIIAVLFRPLGFGHWEAAVATLTGLIAKENVVGTFGILYSNLAEVSENGKEIWDGLRNDFTPIAGYSFLVFNLLCAPCFAAIGAIRREMNSAKWTLFAISYQCIFAYFVSFCIYQIATFISTGIFNYKFILASFLVLLFVYLLFRKNKNELKMSK